MTAITGLANFRDLGGLPTGDGGVTRTGVLFRSDSLSYATDAEGAHLEDVLGLRTVVDLREKEEVDEFGRGPLATSAIDYVSVPLGDIEVAADTRHAFYFGLFEQRGPELAGLVRHLTASDSLPALVHCHIGCDRTGTVSAMLLGLVGVPDEEIALDYARSTRASEAIRERSEARRRHLGLPVMDRSYYDAWEPRPDIMATTLALVNERWGNMQGWAIANSLTDDDLATLHKALVTG
jgi:protein-tyrosine phosphatase